MESISVSEFKAKCLSILDNVKRQNKKVIITKRGVPIAEIVPIAHLKKDIPLKDTVQYMGDIISPVAEDEWVVLK